MRAAEWPRDAALRGRLLVVDATGAPPRDASVDDLPRLLAPGDVLVLNDAATLPASFSGRDAGGHPVELRLVSWRGGGDWSAILFGAGTWRQRTEDRAPPAPLAPGDTVHLAGDLIATVLDVDPDSQRWLGIRFEVAGDALWPALYRAGRPIQYSHLNGPLDLWDVQTRFAGRPWAVEAPSAGFPLTAGLLGSLRRARVEVRALTHAAGLSSTGDAELDRRLPVPERFEIPEATARAVVAAKASGRRVVAAGTTVVRALEGSAAAHRGLPVAGASVTDLRLGAGTRLAVVDALLTGLHEPGTSHFALLEAFAPAEVLRRALAHAERAHYLGHEFGDVMLLQRSGARNQGA